MQPFVCCDPVHLLRQCKRINTVKKLEQRKRVANFIFLEMTDVMPMQVRGKFRDLNAGFLDTAFAEQRLASLDRLTHFLDRKSTRLNSSHRCISYAVFCLKKKSKT